MREVIALRAAFERRPLPEPMEMAREPERRPIKVNKFDSWAWALRDPHGSGGSTIRFDFL